MISEFTCKFLQLCCDISCSRVVKGEVVGWGGGLLGGREVEGTSRADKNIRCFQSLRAQERIDLLVECQCWGYSLDLVWLGSQGVHGASSICCLEPFAAERATPRMIAPVIGAPFFEGPEPLSPGALNPFGALSGYTYLTVDMKS